ncbi:MAG: hypothetical protein ACLSXO_02185 [Coprococcus sp.]
MKNLYDEKHQIVNTVGILKYSERNIRRSYWKKNCKFGSLIRCILRCKIDLETEMVVKSMENFERADPLSAVFEENILSVTGKED